MPKNDNLSEDQKRQIQEVLMMTSAAHKFIESGQSEEAKGIIEEALVRLVDLAKA